MSRYALDAIFDHYVKAVLRRATVTVEDGRWRASVHWLEDMHAVGPDQMAALQQLGEQIAQRVFTQMRRGGQIAVVDGIDLNGGSC